jgi:hypothetical protein
MRAYKLLLGAVLARSRSIGQRNVGSWPEIYSVDEA